MAGAPAHRLPFLHHGSSPHMRGTLAHLLPSADELRFIPAWAGNARCPVAAETSSTVHPRMRGERCSSWGTWVAMAGSSPHTRGTHHLAPRHAVQQRFIPAYAGNAARSMFSRIISAVHPRMCGERGTQPCGVLRLLGSSPHTRGTRRPRVRSHKTRRFIPACAGNAGTNGRKPATTSVHPRMCGERLQDIGYLQRNAGPSPHVRGTH